MLYIPRLDFVGYLQTIASQPRGFMFCLISGLCGKDAIENRMISIIGMRYDLHITPGISWEKIVSIVSTENTRLLKYQVWFDQLFHFPFNRISM